MTASDPGQDELAQPSALSKKNVRFFNVSLRNGIVMSTPSYPEKQSFVAHLIRALETSNPDFAWVQFLFVSSNYGADLIRLKNSMHRAKTAIEQPSLDLVSGEEQDRRQLYRDYYRRADSRMKKVDEIVTKPTITMAIQGMWVSDEPDSVYALPFDHCSDEHDSLALFRYRDPRMLLELVDRRMVVRHLGVSSTDTPDRGSSRPRSSSRRRSCSRTSTFPPGRRPRPSARWKAGPRPGRSSWPVSQGKRRLPAAAMTSRRSW